MAVEPGKVEVEYKRQIERKVFQESELDRLVRMATQQERIAEKRLPQDGRTKASFSGISDFKTSLIGMSTLNRA